MKCPVCEGKGVFEEYIDYQLCDKYECPYCKGKARISVFSWLGYHFWENAPEWVWDLYIWIADRIRREREG